ncbi:hypothetical protein SAMN04489731_106108 [Amycolatopsis regifaucium]|nr:hypothetical protein SAMN04489731_106108 [Amycolatopsis regifaucium]
MHSSMPAEPLTIARIARYGPTARYGKADRAWATGEGDGGERTRRAGATVRINRGTPPG